MSTIWTFVRATAVVAGSSAALLIGGLMGTAHADPAVPAMPGPDIGQQLMTSVAGAPQVLQNLATAMGAQPPTPPPLASAAIKVPQPPAGGLPGAASAVPSAASAVPGASSLLPGAASPSATSTTPALGIPGLTPTAPASTASTSPVSGLPGLTPSVPASSPATGPAGLLPEAKLNLPQLPFLGVPLPQQISLPGDLTSLATGGVPSAPSVPVAAPVSTPNPLLFPVSGLP